MYYLTKFARVYGAQSGNMCKVDHQALFYVKVLNETHLYISILIILSRGRLFKAGPRLLQNLKELRTLRTFKELRNQSGEFLKIVVSRLP